MDTRPTERVMNLNRSFGRGAAVSSKVAELVERSDDKVIAALRISRFRIPLQSGTAKGGTKQTERNHLDFIRPRSSAWIEQRFPKPEVGRSNRLGGTSTFPIARFSRPAVLWRGRFLMDGAPDHFRLPIFDLV